MKGLKLIIAMDNYEINIINYVDLKKFIYYMKWIKGEMLASTWSSGPP